MELVVPTNLISSQISLKGPFHAFANAPTESGTHFASGKRGVKWAFNPLPVPGISKRVPSRIGRSTKVCAASTSVCGRPAWTGRVARSTIRHGRRELAVRLPRPFPVSKRPSHSPAAAEEVYSTSLTPASRRLAPDAE